MGSKESELLFTKPYAKKKTSTLIILLYGVVGRGRWGSVAINTNIYWINSILFYFQL